MEQQLQHDVFISFSFKDQGVADRIVNHLTNLYGISCWICTEEIKAGENFRADIVQAIMGASLVVLVQSKKSVVSAEVFKEIKYALKKGKMVKPFMIEDSQLAEELEFEMPTTHYIDATRPELDDRIRELAKDICRSLGRPFEVNEKGMPAGTSLETLLSTPSVIPKRVFCGRDSVLKDIHERFREERVLFLHGIGGIGKTQIAKQYAKRFAADYDVIVYATYDGSLKQMILGDTPFALEPEMVRYTLSDGSKEDDDAFYQRKLNKIKKLANERTLVIVDNFDVEDDPCLADMVDGKYRLLITTRCDYSRFFSTVRIGAIEDMEDLKKVFFQNYDGFDAEEDDPAVEELIDLVNRHTYTIELLAQHMENSGQLPTEMVRALKKEGILSLNEKVLNGEMKTQVAYENLLKMFKLFSLSGEEQEILMYLSLMPPEGVSVREFKQWAGITSNSTLKALERKSWITKNTEGIALHPIICQVIKHEIIANEENCGGFIARFTESIAEKNTWHIRKSEKDRYAAITKCMLSRFPVLNKATEALYRNAESLMSFAVDPEYAAVLAERLWEYARKTYNEASFEAGHAAFKRGWLYAYNSQLPDSVRQACAWLGKANDILEQIPLQTSDQRAALVQNLTNLSKMHTVMYRQSRDPEDYKASVTFAQKALEYALATFQKGEHQYAKVAGCHWQLADALCEGGCHEEALRHVDVAVDILMEMYTSNDSDTIFALYRKAVILYALGDISAARELAKKSADGYVEFVGVSHPNTYRIHVLLGECCVKLGEHGAAVEAFEKALKTARLIYAPDSVQITDIEEKLRELSLC